MHIHTPVHACAHTHTHSGASSPTNCTSAWQETGLWETSGPAFGTEPCFLLLFIQGNESGGGDSLCSEEQVLPKVSSAFGGLSWGLKCQAPESSGVHLGVSQNQERPHSMLALRSPGQRSGGCRAKEPWLSPGLVAPPAGRVQGADSVTWATC